MLLLTSGPSPAERCAGQIPVPQSTIGSWIATRRSPITTGATAAILSSLMAFVESGDEVIVFEPFFNLYGPFQGSLVDGSAIDSIVTSTSSGSLAV